MIRLVISTVLFFLVSEATAKDPFLSLFSKEKPIIAAIMVEKDLSSDKKVTEALRWSLQQIEIAETQGMDGILFEFRGGKILEPKMTEKKFQAMQKMASALVKASKNLVVGVEILWHFPEETLRLAKESGASFVRLDFFSDQVIADKKQVPINPKKLLQYRKKIGAENVVLLTDIQVKYSKMVDPKISLEQSAQKAVQEGSDGLIVTSTQSGRAPEPERLRKAQLGAGTKPVVIGSGFSYKNAASLLKYADAVIVGTSISVKTGGPLVPKKVKALMDEVRSFRKKQYPEKWWSPVVKAKKKSWEITPDTVQFPNVILSKRNELGLLSNFASTPFSVAGRTFASMEGYWQAMKFPEGQKDPRMGYANWPFTRSQVEGLTAFEAKKAGDFGSEIMQMHDIDWVTWKGQKMNYREKKKGLFYQKIRQGMTAKLLQNKEVMNVLCKTKSLNLLPDHFQGSSPPPAWRYHDIWMELRKEHCSL